MASRRRSHRSRSALVWFLLGFLAVGALGGLLAVDVLAVRAILVGSERDVRIAQGQVQSGDLVAASETVSGVRHDIGDAVHRTNRLLWRAGELVPIVGPSLEVGRGIVAVIDRSSLIAHNALDVMELLLDDDGHVRIEAVDGQLPIDTLRAAGDVAATLDVESLGAALRHLRGVGGPLLDEVAAVRERILVVGDDLFVRAMRARGALAAAPTTLGSQGERRYLLGMQNLAELRGTGGLLGFVAVVTANQGRLHLSEPAAYGALDTIGEPPDSEPSIDGVPNRFFERYGAVTAVGNVGNINLDPDLPTVGPVVLGLFEARTGQRLDGVILVDPIAVARVIDEIGPVEIPEEIAATAPDLPNPIAAERFAEITMTDHYASFEGDNSGRRAYLVEVASAAFNAMFDGGWDGVEVVRALVDAAAGGHVAIYDRDEQIQDSYALADLAGALEPVGFDGDLLAVTANNSAGNKLDRLVSHRLDVSIEILGGPRRGLVQRRTEIGMWVDNPVRRGELSPYVAGSAALLGEDPPTAGEEPPALSRTWFSFWAPSSSAVQAHGDGAVDGSWVIRNQRVVDAVVDAAPRGQGSAFATVEGSVELQQDRGRWVYTLDIRRPPKAIPDTLDLELLIPDGWEVAEVRYYGGVAAAGVGGELEWASTERGMRLWGEMTASLRLEVTFARR